MKNSLEKFCGSAQKRDPNFLACGGLFFVVVVLKTVKFKKIGLIKRGEVKAYLL